MDEQLRLKYPDERATHEGDVLEELLRFNFIACGSNTLMRRAALEKAGAFDEALEAVEDWELHTRLAAHHAFAAVAEVVVWYRRSPRSLSSRFQEMERSFLAASRKIFSTVPAGARSLEGHAKASFYRYILARTMQSRDNSGKWRAIPRFAVIAAWHDPAGFLRACWYFCTR